MKKLILMFVLVFAASLSFANSNGFEKIMRSKIEVFNQAKSLEELQSSANTFNRISQKETKEWLPLYYEAFAYVKMGFNSSLELDQKDIYFDKAIEIIKKAKLISENNSELTSMEGYALMGKLSADAGSRGPGLSPQVLQLFRKAVALDSQNPRALHLLAQMEYGMAQFFGKTSKEACALNSKSITLFENETDRGIYPSWGLANARSFSKNCQ